MSEIGLDMIKSFSPKKNTTMRYLRSIVRKIKIKKLFNL